MATKNFLSSRSEVFSRTRSEVFSRTRSEVFSRTRSEFKVWFIASALLISACQTGLKTHDDLEQEKHGPPSRTSPTRTAAPNTNGYGGSVMGGEPGVSTTPGASLPPVVQTPAPAPGTGAFLQKEAPHIGLILGPGGMKAFAHVGVLKEFARARVPITAITGLEWGAIFAGLYAVQGQSNDVEWKALRLREQDIPGKALFSEKTKPEAIATLADYLNTVFGASAIEKSKIPFACPSAALASDHVQWLARGSLRDAMSKCVPYPPYFTANAGMTAAPLAIEEAAQNLRAHGANFVIYVNVLAQSENFPRKLLNDYYAENVLWSEIRRKSDAAGARQVAGINATINVVTADRGLMDFEDRRSLIDAGSKAARDQANKFSF